MKKTDVFSFVKDPTEGATSKSEFLFLLLIVTPMLYITLFIATIAFLVWAFSFCGLIYVLQALDQGNYWVAGLIVLFDIAVLIFYVIERLKARRL